MVDRVAAMLNYFLCHLVGPKKKNFKVSIINRTAFKSYSYFPSDISPYVTFASNLFFNIYFVIFRLHNFIKIYTMSMIVLG